MLRAFRTTRRKSVRSTVAGFALAIALAGGVAVGSTAITSETAQAQNSRGFADAFGPVAEMVQPDVGNFEGARAAIPTVIAAIENENDRQVAGNLILNIGNNLNDASLQIQGLQMMVDSGLLPPEQVAQYNSFIGRLAFQNEDWPTARAGFAAAQAAGFSDPEVDLVALTAETYAREDDIAGAVSYTMSQVEAREAAGQTVPEAWLLSRLQDTYDFDMSAEALAISEALIRNHPTQRNWQNTLRIVNQLFELEPEVRIDLFRLMRLNDAIVDRSEYVRYIEDLDPRVMSNEVQQVLAQGLDNGVFEAGDVYYTEVKAIADQRAPQDRNGIDRIVAEGENGDALDAIGAGDVLYSISDFARAETMYRTALERGYDADTANTRIGITQAQQGNYAAAVETFGQVQGQREPVARMWTAYANYMMAEGA
ncbi:hypothetical protein OZN62_02180 [Aurantiacibacter sp. MUD11]|uniref:tetratricopeptide repeat protein n=1 Tax=Aurantiacibacter sp. MUD11 TaxID=3003265 RepID=UPI0022AAAD45|nr:hypothetical protein [Aurantiacibacter sp. MUD11]WAT18409.1 hypothetical protein OZN62_02180 [Aurantiacibacter sp. MUD11]